MQLGQVPPLKDRPPYPPPCLRHNAAIASSEVTVFASVALGYLPMHACSTSYVVPRVPTTASEAAGHSPWLRGIPRRGLLESFP